MSEINVTPAGNTRTLTLRRILVLHELLSSLDGHVETITGPDGKPARGKVTPYSIGAKGRYAIIKGLKILGRFVETVQKARDAIITEVSEGTGSIAPKDPEHPEQDPVYMGKLAQVNEQLNALLDTEETVAGLIAIPIEDLRLDVNSLLPNTTIVALGDLVTEPAA